MNRCLFALLFTIFGWPIAARAQTISLPTFHVFSYSGTVEVPDGGTISLGGNGYAASSRSQRGGFFPGPVARSGIIGASNASVTATIIDQQEIDRQLLGGTPKEFMKRQRQAEARAAGDVSDRTSISTRRRAVPDDEGKALVRHARELHRQGRHQAASDTYRMAASMLEWPLRELALAEMKRVGLE